MRKLPFLLVTLAAVAVTATVMVRKKAPTLPWPRKAVTLLVPISAGAGIDLSARLFAEKLSQKWGQPVVVDNRPSGDAVLGFAIFASGKDDHTLLFSAAGPITMDALIRDDLPFDAKRDFVPIAAVAQPTVVIAASSALPATSLRELEVLAKKSPREYYWSGIGQLGNFFQAFLKLEKLEMTYVPYRSPPEAVQDLGAGRLHIWMSSLATVESQLRAGKARILAVTNTNRSSAIPEVPTVTEAGYPGLALDGIWGFFGWRGMSNSLRTKIAEDVRAVAAEPTVVARMSSMGLTAAFSPPDELAELLDHQRSQFGKIIEILELKKAAAKVRP